MVDKRPGETREETEFRILKDLKMGGLLNEDEPVLPAFDGSFRAEGGGLLPSVDSAIFSLATTQKGTLKKTSKTITTKDFHLLLDFTEKKLQEMKIN